MFLAVGEWRWRAAGLRWPSLARDLLWWVIAHVMVRLWWCRWAAAVFVVVAASVRRTASATSARPEGEAATEGKAGFSP